MFDEYIALYARRDDRLAALFSLNFTGFTGSWGRLIHNRDEWVRITRQDFEQVPGPIRLEVIDVALQDLSDEVVSVAATVPIHLPDNPDFLSREVARLLLVFRLEGAAWKITHCSYSVPHQSAQDDEVYISPADERLRGFRADEVVGRPVFEWLSNEASALFRDVLSCGTMDAAQPETNRFCKFEIPT